MLDVPFAHLFGMRDRSMNIGQISVIFIRYFFILKLKHVPNQHSKIILKEINITEQSIFPLKIPN